MKNNHPNTLLGGGLYALLLVGTLVGSPVAQAKVSDIVSDGERPAELLVQLRSPAALVPLLSKYPLTVLNQFGARPIYRLHVTSGADTQSTITALQAELDVIHAEPNFTHQSPEARKISSWAIGAETAYTAQWAPQALRLAHAQQISTGAGMRVAVLDTGVDALHPALAGKLLPGFDFVDFDTNAAEVGDHTTNINFGHGTHVAGLVALVAPSAKIMPLRVLDSNGQGNVWVLAEAMLYAIDPDHNPATDDGAHVINISLGSTKRTHILDTVAKLATCALAPAVTDPLDDFADPAYDQDRNRCNAFNGAVVVVAAGNDASADVRQYPAAEGVYGLIAVTASNVSNRIASFSNTGQWIHVAAPGEGITSTVPGGGFGTWSGTSMAAPLTAGTAALVRATNPDMTAKDIARRIARASANLCGTKLRQVDAVAAITNVMPADRVCR